MSVTLYSQPTCYPCKGVKRELDSLGIEYTVKDITQDAEARERLIELGYSSTPVIELSSGEHWHGHRPGRLQQALLV